MKIFTNLQESLIISLMEQHKIDQIIHLIGDEKFVKGLRGYSDAKLFCLSQGNGDEPAPGYESYLYENAIGIFANKTGDYTFRRR